MSPRMLTAGTRQTFADFTQPARSPSSKGPGDGDQSGVHQRDELSGAVGNSAPGYSPELDRVDRALHALVDAFLLRNISYFAATSVVQDSGYGASAAGFSADHGQSCGSPAKACEAAAHQTFLFCKRVLGSRMMPSVVCDEFHVADLIRKTLVRRHKSSNKAMRFSDLFNRLQRQTIVIRKWSILYLLLQLSQDPEEANFETSSVLATAPTEQLFASMGLQNLSTSERISSRYGSPAERLRPEQPFVPITHKEVDKTMDKRTPYAVLLASRVACKNLPESLLLRDVTYILQGIDGKHIRFDEKNRSFAMIPNACISRSQRDIMIQIAESGWLYRRVVAFVKRALDYPAVGLIGQAFCSSLQAELTDYYRLIAILEAQIVREEPEAAQSASPARGAEVDSALLVKARAAAGTGLTLKRLLVWMQEVAQKLRLMSVLAECSTGRKGGGLVSFIHTYMNHGDPFIQQFVDKMLEEVSRPFYHLLQMWLYEGRLEDPYSEFFVAVNVSTQDDDMWSSKYLLNPDMVPTFMGRPLANKVFLIGKSLTFIQKNCKDAEWLTEQKRAYPPQSLSYRKISELENFVQGAYQRTSERLLELLLSKYRLMDHFRALKKYLLLGQGDFVQYLMNLLGPTLDQPANTIFRHNLTGTLETVIRCGNMQYDDPDILKRLDVRLLEVSKDDTGWDVFSLDYHVDPPISTILNPPAMHKYLRLFNFLWRLKRAEHVLAAGWRRQMTTAHALGGVHAIAADLHTSCVTCAEMVHFVYQMQYYMVFEVLECSWDELAKYVGQRKGDLDELIDAHNTYLDNILKKSLLVSGTPDNIRVQFIGLFDIILKFRKAQEALYDHGCRQVERRARLSQKAYQRTLQGKWGLTEDDEYDEGLVGELAEEGERELEDIRSRISKVSKQFRKSLCALLKSLSNHRDMNAKSLAVRLNYNEHYLKQQM